MKTWTTIPAWLFGLSVILLGQVAPKNEPDVGYPYVAAMYRASGRLALFPLAGARETEITLPVPLGGYDVSPDGKALYTTSGEFSKRPEPGLFKIEFGPIRVSGVPGFDGFRFYSSKAISSHQDEVVVAGKFWNGSRLVCGVFDLDLLHRSVRQVLNSEDCDDAITRTDISLAPDSRHAVAIHGRTLELIDMANGESRNLAEGFLKAAWAPNGRWIAAARYSGLRARTVLFDAKTFTAGKTLASSTVLRVSWSPDSRFLLARKLESGCGPDEYTYETFEVETAKESVIESSRCKVLGNDVGWIDMTSASK